MFGRRSGSPLPAAPADGSAALGGPTSGLGEEFLVGGAGEGTAVPDAVLAPLINRPRGLYTYDRGDILGEALRFAQMSGDAADDLSSTADTTRPDDAARLALAAGAASEAWSSLLGVARPDELVR
jgi:hypothetical protein